MTTKDYCSINFTGLTHDHSLECRSEEVQIKQADAATNGEPDHESAYCSAIPILKQHPMYDCLVLVRKFRKCLGGYSLEFPIDRVREHERLPTNESPGQHQQDCLVDSNTPPGEGPDLDSQNTNCTTGEGEQARRRLASSCSQRRLVSRFLDGDDPMYRASLKNSLSQVSISGHLACAGPAEAQDSRASSPRAPNDDQAPSSTTATGDANAADANLLFMTQIDDRGDQCHLVHVPINGLLDRLESYTRNGVAVDSRVYAFAMGLKTAERMMTTKSMKELHETPI